MARLFPRSVAGLILDTDDVLYDATVWRRWLVQLLTRLGVHTTYTCLFRVWDREYLDDVYRGRRSFCEAFASFLLAIGLSRAQIDEVEAACQARRRLLEEGARPLPGVKTTLARLREAGLVLGVLANSEHRCDAIRRQLDRFGMADTFAAVVSSIDLGRAKPDPAAYLAALQQMNLRPEQAAFVGHDTAELAGAAAAGVQTIAFNYDRDAQADVFLTRFDELLDVVGIRTRYAAAG
jgi:HAD superfamily hydrolase (TIGR01509 family)